MPVEPNATNPDGNATIDASLDPNQVKGNGNPSPPAPQAKDPNFKPADKQEEKKEEPKPDDKSKEPDPKPDPKKEAPLDTAVWGDTSSENGNAVLTLLQNAGVTPVEAKGLLFDAVQAGDLSKVDRKALEDRLGKANATIVMTGADNFIKEQKSKANAIVAELHTEVGGKDNWQKVAAWANENVPAEEIEEFRAMINGGGMKAKMAARELKARYESADSNSSLEVKETLPGGKPSTPVEPPLSKQEYIKKLETLTRNHFGNPPAHLRQALLDARKRGAALGK